MTVRLVALSFATALSVAPFFTVTAQEPATRDESATPPVTLELPSEPVDIGEPVSIDVHFGLSPGSSVLNISVAGNAFIELVGRGNLSTPGVAEQHWRVEAVVFRAGRFDADGLVVRLIDANGESQSLRSGPFSITTLATIDSASPPEREPTAEPLAVITKDNRPLWALAALALVALGWLVRRTFTERPSELISEPPPPPRPAWEVALERLQALEGSEYFKRGEAIEFHMELSEILREFIGRHYGFPAVESTTREIAAVLDRDRVGSRQARELLRILADTDMVKFARQSLPEDESMSMLIRGRAVVLDLTARERQAEQAGAAGTGPGSDGNVEHDATRSFDSGDDRQEEAP